MDASFGSKVASLVFGGIKCEKGKGVWALGENRGSELLGVRLMSKLVYDRVSTSKA